MSKIEEPLEKGWLGHVMRDVRNEVAAWPSDSSFPKPGRNEPHCEDAAKSAPATSALDMK
jgi:hypothetical protein